MTPRFPPPPLRAFVRPILARPRLVVSVLVGVATVLALPRFAAMPQVSRAIVGWNAGACFYLVLAARMMS